MYVQIQKRSRVASNMQLYTCTLIYRYGKITSKIKHIITKRGFIYLFRHPLNLKQKKTFEGGF